MAKFATKILLFCSFFILFSSQVTCQEIDDESEYNYDPNGDKGPEYWGGLNPEWYACGNGTMQSPIDLLNDRVIVDPCLGRLKRNYRPSNSTLKNSGHDISLEWEDAGSIVLNWTEYYLQQIHWHSPSEHTIDGKRFDLEAHMVHQSSDGKVAVIGILYTIGQPDNFLASLEDDLLLIIDGNEESVVGKTNPMNVEIGSGQDYYRYIGSLTTPPCTEGVLWTIVTKVRTVSDEQVRLLRVAVHDAAYTNARPVQALNGREILLFGHTGEEEKEEAVVGHDEL
ncbi:hypothetical protein ACFE04_015477 [Oxalis oulophora]